MLIPTDAAVIVPTWTIKPDEYPSFGKVKFNKYIRTLSICLNALYA
jgi:hypothetical protein